MTCKEVARMLTCYFLGHLPYQPLGKVKVVGEYMLEGKIIHCPRCGHMMIEWRDVLFEHPMCPCSMTPMEDS